MPLGWHITVFRQQHDESNPADFKSATSTRLAVWQAGVDGLDWIGELVKQQQAIRLGGDGYPSRFTATAKHIIPRIRGKTTKDPDAMKACRPDEWLLIEVWDES